MVKFRLMVSQVVWLVSMVVSSIMLVVELVFIWSY